MLKDLVPSDLHRAMSPQEWSRQIETAYKRDAGMKPEDAKVAMLKLRSAKCRNLYLDAILWQLNNGNSNLKG